MFLPLFWTTLKAGLFIVSLILLLSIPAACAKLKRRLEAKRPSIVFFHPRCNDGGGGEKVLWQMIKALDENRPDLSLSIYSSASGDVLQSVRDRFGIELTGRIDFIPIRSYWVVEPWLWPVATLLGTSLASIFVAVEACIRHSPDIMIDTVGHAFTYPVFRLLSQCKIACYVHYPTISTDMIHPVRQRKSAVNNSELIARSNVLSRIKLLYYEAFSLLYRGCGVFSRLVMVNSSWTKNHIDTIWGISSTLVYPPCDVRKLLKDGEREQDTFTVVSVAQFRPEKRLDFQLNILDALLRSEPELIKESRLCWCFVGSSRNEGDLKRVQELKQLAANYDLDKYAQFHLNLPFEQLLELMAKSTVAIHTMIEEHFGIAVVECMAAGLITIANATGGPKMDILNSPEVGFTASSLEDYVAAITAVMRMPEEARTRIRKNARAHVLRFESDEFRKRVISVLTPLLG